MRLASFLLTLVIAAPAEADSLTSIGGHWARYTNDRFGTVIDLPLLFTVIEPPPTNGDGREFSSKDGARLRVYGSHGSNTVTGSFDEYKTWLIAEKGADLHITYKAEGKGWIAFSGLKGSMIAYEKVIEGCDAGHHLSVEYPASKKKLYDPIVTRMARSLRCRPALSTAHYRGVQ